MATPRTSTRGCVGHRRASANGTTPYAPCLISRAPLSGNLLHTDLPPAPQDICSRAGLFPLIWPHPAGGDSKFFSRIRAKVSDLRSVLCLGRERRFLAGNHQFSVFRIGREPDLHPAPPAARVPRQLAQRQPIDDGARVHCATTRERSARPAARIGLDD